MALQNTFGRDAGGLTRQAPRGYQRYVDTSSFTPEQQAAFNRAASLAPAGSIASSTVTPIGGGSPMLPSSVPVQGAAKDPSDSFNNLMMGLLESAKGLNTSDLLKKRRLLERAQTERSSALTPEDEQMLSPSQQNAIRSGRVEALNPEIDVNAYELEKAQQSIDNFFKVFDSAQKISKEWADKAIAPDSVIKNAQMIIQADPDKMATVLASFNDKSKSAVLEGLDYSKLAPKPKEKEGFTLGEGQVRYDAAGNVIAKGPAKAGDATSQFDIQRAVTAADTVLKDLSLGEQGNLAGVFGRFQQYIPSQAMKGDQAYLYNKLSQLRQTIVLALRAKLKGQGTITDQETAMLEKASTAISRNLDIEDVKAEVEEMKTFLQTQLSGGGGFIVDSPDGPVEIID